MKIIYLLQGELPDLALLVRDIPSNQFIMSLNYEVDPEKLDFKSDFHIYFPNSTWASGRNLLLKEAKALQIDFDYYVFIDADLRISKGSFEQFETFLATFKPKLGLPLCDQVRDSYRYIPKAVVQTQFSFDQICQAYRADVVFESICVPFETDFDSESWWYSCEINQYLSILHCRTEILQYNDFEIVNSRHDGAELSTLGLSNYRGGTDKRGMQLCKELIQKKHGKQQPLVGTLFHPRYLPALILFPNMRQLLHKDFSGKSALTFKSVAGSLAKSSQDLIYKTVFRSSYLINRVILERIS